MRRWIWALALVACDDGGSAPMAADGALAGMDGGALDGAPDDAGDATIDQFLVVEGDIGSVGGAGGEGGAGGGGAGGAGGGGGGGPPVALPPEDDCVASVIRIGPLDVFAYEASRPDATAVDAGADASRACSRAGVLPWTEVTVDQASAHCEAAGFHLCSDREWQDACGGAQRQWPFPYASVHRPGACNDHVSGTNMLQPTGAMPDCVSPDGVYDMSGNVWELTADLRRRGASHRVNAVMFRVESARCDVPYDVNAMFYADDLGFRCCRAAQ